MTTTDGIRQRRPAKGAQSMARLPALARMPVVVMALALAAGLAGCVQNFSGSDTAPESARPDAAALDDDGVRLSLERRLIKDGKERFGDVAVLVFDRRVMLVGMVPDAGARNRAADIAAATAGVAEVIDELQVAEGAGLGGFLSDVMIEKTIQTDFLFDSGIESAHYRVRAVNGVVYMIGRAASESELARAIALARATGDVKQVVSHVAVAGS